MDDKTLRASFLAAESTMLAGIDHAIEHLAQEYSGPQVSHEDVQLLEKALQEKIEKLNASLALYFTTHSDPKNIKYHSAMVSMFSINQLINDIPTDALMLCSSMDLKSRKKLLDNMQVILEDVRRLCSVKESNERDKIHEECYKYTNMAEIFLFTLTRQKKNKKEDQIIKLAWEMDDSSFLLLTRANVLRRKMSPNPLIENLKSAIQPFEAATRDLLICTQFSTVAVHNTHYRRAISAACEALTFCLNQLSATWEALEEDCNIYHLTCDLNQYKIDIHNVLKNLKEAILDKGLNAEIQPVQESQHQNSVTNGDEANMLEKPQKETDKPAVISVSLASKKMLHHRLLWRVTQLNAVVAMFTSVPPSVCTNHTDKINDMREEAINLISQLTEQIYDERREVIRSRNGDISHRIQQYIFDLCDITKEMITKNKEQANLVDYASKVYETSCELILLVYPEKRTEGRIVDELANWHNTISMTKSHFSETPPDSINKRDRCEIAARNLLSVAQITALTLNDARCRNILSLTMEELQVSFKELMAVTPNHLIYGHETLFLNENFEENLEYVVISLHNLGEDEKNVSSAKHSNQRQHFIKTLVDTRILFLKAKHLIKKRKLSVEAHETVSEEEKQLLVEMLSQLNATTAALLLSFDGKSSEYATAQRAVNIIADLIPQIMEDVGKLREADDYHGIQEDFQRLCAAGWTICNVRHTIEYNNAGQTEILGEAAELFGEVSRDLISRLSPGPSHGIPKKLADLSRTARNNASSLQALTQTLIKQMPQGTNTALEIQACDTFTTAKILFTAIAKVTDPTINRTECLMMLMSAVEHLRRSATEMISKCCPHAIPDSRNKQIVLLVHEQLDEYLNKFVQFCRQSIAELDRCQITEKRSFNNSVSHALETITTYQKEIDEELQTRAQLLPCDEADVKKLSRVLLNALKDLYAAIAALVLVTCDCEEPYYATGQSALRKINVYFSCTVKERLRVLKDESTRTMILRYTQELCETCKAILLNAEQTKDLYKTITKFYEACKQLMFYFGPTSDSEGHENTCVLAATCNWVRELILVWRQQLTDQLPLETQKMLRGRRGTAAQAVLTIARLTSTTIVASNYSRELMSAAVDLRLSSKELTSACCTDMSCEDEIPPVQVAQQQLKECLDELIQTCRQTQRADRLGASIDKPLRGTHSSIIEESDEESPQVMANMMRTEMNQRMKESDGDSVKHQLLKIVAKFYTTNAIVNASLSDPECLQQARTIFSSIVNLMSLIVEDSCALKKHLDSALHERVLQQVDQMCDIVKAINSNNATNDIEEMVADLSKVSYKLIFTLVPGIDHGPYKEIVNQSALSWMYGCKLIYQVRNITEQAADEVAVELEKPIKRTIFAGKNMQTAIQDTDLFLSSPLCIRPLRTAITELQLSSNKLKVACSPHIPPDSQQYLNNTLQQLNYNLNRLLKACQYINTDIPSTSTLEVEDVFVQRQRFDRILEDAKTAFSRTYRVHKFSTKPKTLEDKSEKEMLQLKFLNRVIQFDDAVTAFVGALSDYEPPKYSKAEEAINNISTLVLLIIQDLYELSAMIDDIIHGEIVQLVRRLYDACVAVYNNANDMQALRKAAETFKNAFLKLKFIVTTGGYREPQQITELSAIVYTRASDLVSDVQKLTREALYPATIDVHEWEVNTFTAAQDLINITEKLVSDLRSSHCLMSLESIVTKCRRSAAELITSCTHIKLDGKQRLRTLQKQLNDSLDLVLHACREAHESVCSKEKLDKHMKFIETLSTTQIEIQYADVRLQQPEVSAFMTTSNKEWLCLQLSITLKHISNYITRLTDVPRSNTNTIIDEVAEQDLLQQILLLRDLSGTICDKVELKQDISEAADIFFNTFASMKSMLIPLLTQYFPSI